MFDTLDEQLATQILQHLPLMTMPGMDFETRCRALFLAVWRLMVENRENCLAFIRYYYSPYYIKHSAEAHWERYQPVLEKFRRIFKAEADVWMILNHMLNVMLDFAVKVHNGHMSSEDNYVEHVFRVVYRSVEQYFKEEEVKENG